MLQMHDIVKIELSPARVQHLYSGGEESRRLADHNGATMRIGGIQRLQLPDELRTFVLEDIVFPVPPYVYAPRGDLKFVRHGEPASRAAVPPEPPSPEAGLREQLDLFAEAQ